jgi:hypothetical protein
MIRPKNRPTASHRPNAAFRAVARWAARINDSYWGDALGAAGLFSLLFLSSFIVGAIQ